eukprot:10196.XXX_336193_336453_1 [CDS] Oithona nana genome sequencing.
MFPFYLKVFMIRLSETWMTQFGDSRMNIVWLHMAILSKESFITSLVTIQTPFGSKNNLNWLTNFFKCITETFSNFVVGPNIERFLD